MHLLKRASSFYNYPMNFSYKLQHYGSFYNTRSLSKYYIHRPLQKTWKIVALRALGTNKA